MEKTDEEDEYTGGDTILRVQGNIYRCACGANVFSRSTKDPNCYRCNNCRTEYETDPIEKEDK